MPKPPETKPQRQRFIDKARELGCDEDPKAFERTFSKIVPPKRPTPKQSKPLKSAERKSKAKKPGN